MRIIFYILFCVLTQFSIAQQLTQYSQWSTHQFSFNPAHAGIKQCVDIHSLFRTQWVGFDGAPKSGFLTVSIPLQAQRKQFLSARHGTGFKFETDRIGQFGFNRINAAYAAHFNFDKTNRLSLGLYAGIVQMAYDPSTTIVLETDPAVFNQANFIAPDASFGAWYNAENFYAGLTLQSLITSKWKDIGYDSRHRFHANIHGGYRFAVNDDISLLPGILLKFPPRGPWALDLNMHLDYKNFLNVGLGYRNTDALMAFVSIRLIDQLTIGYSFDYTLSAVQLAAKNTHEISIRFTTCKVQRQGSADCPMFE